MRGFNFKKAVQALNYLASKNGGNINKMKAIKLIWLADRLHLRKYGRTITGDQYFAMINGPVPSATRDILESSVFLTDSASDYASEYISFIDRYNFRSIHEPIINVFSKTDLESLDLIHEYYNHLDHFSLSEFSHKFPEWIKYEVALKKGISSRFTIDLYDFFENKIETGELFQDEEEGLKLTKAIYEEQLNILQIVS